MQLKATVATLIFTMIVTAIPGVAISQDNASDSTPTVTGCLQKGSTANNYTMTDENGKLWDLHSKAVQLGPHVVT